MKTRKLMTLLKWKLSDEDLNRGDEETGQNQGDVRRRHVDRQFQNPAYDEDVNVFDVENLGPNLHPPTT